VLGVTMDAELLSPHAMEGVASRGGGGLVQVGTNYQSKSVFSRGQWAAFCTWKSCASTPICFPNEKSSRSCAIVKQEGGRPLATGKGTADLKPRPGMADGREASDNRMPTAAVWEVNGTPCHLGTGRTQK
jgi:hypothetical protein